MALVVAGTSKSPSLSGAQYVRARVEGLTTSRERALSLGRALGAQSSHDSSLGRSFAAVLSCLLGSRRLYRRGCLARHASLPNETEREPSFSEREKRTGLPFGFAEANMEAAMYKTILIELPDGQDHYIDVRNKDTTEDIKTILNLELTMDPRTMELETMDGVIMEDDDLMSKFRMVEGTKFRLKLKELPPGAKPFDEEDGVPIVITTAASGKAIKLRLVCPPEMFFFDIKQNAWEILKKQVPYIGDLGVKAYGLFYGDGIQKSLDGNNRNWTREERLWEYTTVGENDMKPEVVLTFANIFFYDGPKRQAKIDEWESKRQAELDEPESK